MQWTDQANTFWNTWAGTQRQMMQELLSAGSPYTKQYATLTNVWREMLAKGIEGRFQESSPVARDVAEQIVSGQQGMMRFLELSVEVWKALLPQIEEGEDWHVGFANYMQGLRQRILDSSMQNMKTNQNSAEMWTMYAQELQKYGLPWLDFVQKAPQFVANPLDDKGNTLIDLNNLFWDTYEQTFGRLLMMPSLGATREINTLVVSNFDIWLNFRRIYTEYEILMAQTWFEAFEQLMTVTLERIRQGQAISSMQEYLQLWIEIADRAFTRFFGSNTYVEMQARLVNAGMSYRLRQRELMEKVMEMYDIPTRTEIDETHRRIHNLRREVRELKRELAAAKQPAQAAEANGAAAPAPAKKPATRKKPAQGGA